MKLSKLFAVALACVAMALVAVGCGGSSDSATPADTAASGGTEEGVEVGGEMMLPSLTIVENAQNAENLTTLVQAVTAAELVETLSGEGPFTVFAPTNDAFAKVDPAALEDLLKPENIEDLQALLTYHVVPGALTSADLKDGDKLETVNGGEIEITEKGGKLLVNGVEIETADVIDSNGVSHVIGEVLMPKAKK